jgi:DNA-directed RNA polymerase subunit RPC12/RpoP
VFRCARCKNTGKILEQYADFPPLNAPSVDAVEPLDIPIKWREVECPDCLGFGAVGWALPG